MNARALTLALRGRWFGTYGTAACVSHDDREPSLWISPGRSVPIVVRCLSGCEQSAVIGELRRRGLWDSEDEGDGHDLPPRWGDNRQRALQLWHYAREARGSTVETYLRSRGLALETPPSIRFEPEAWHGPSKRKLPAMVCAVQSPDRSICGVHRTYVRQDGSGKADVTPAKMMLGSLGCGAVRLAAAGPVLGIAEGIETALSAMELHGVPVWAALSAGRLGRLWLPDEVKTLIVFGDADEAGARSAYAAASGYVREGRRVEVRLPDEGDWNDALVALRRAA